MSLKKIIILPVGFLLVHILYIGCCKCIEGKFQREIYSIRTNEYSLNSANKKDTIFTNDTCYSWIQLDYTMVTAALILKNPLAQMVGSSYATTCNCHDYFDLGFKYPVDSILIISNNTFQSNPPGTNLAPKFKGQFTRYDSLTGNPVLFILPITQLIDSLNKYPRYNTIEMFTSPGIMPVKDQRFSYRVYVNGKTLVSVSTQIVHWF